MLNTTILALALITGAQDAKADDMNCTEEEAKKFMEMRVGKWTGVITVPNGDEVKTERTGKLSRRK